MNAASVLIKIGSLPPPQVHPKAIFTAICTLTEIWLSTVFPAVHTGCKVIPQKRSLTVTPPKIKQNEASAAAACGLFLFFHTFILSSSVPLLCYRIMFLQFRKFLLIGHISKLHSCYQKWTFCQRACSLYKDKLCMETERGDLAPNWLLLWRNPTVSANSNLLSLTLASAK